MTAHRHNKMMEMGRSDMGKNHSESGSFFARGTRRIRSDFLRSLPRQRGWHNKMMKMG
jgi:hypothetical protein